MHEQICTVITDHSSQPLLIYQYEIGVKDRHQRIKCGWKAIEKMLIK